MLLAFRPFETLELVGNSEQLFQPFAYCDSTEYKDSCSQIFEVRATQEEVRFSYLLGTGPMYPYAGVSLHAPDTSYFDIRAFDYLNIQLTSLSGKRLQLHISTFATGFTKPQELLTYRYLLKEIDIDPKTTEFKIPLSEFSTPTWWFNQHKLTEKELDAPEFDKVKVVNIQNCQLLGRNIKDTISVSRLTFSKNTQTFWISLLAALLIYASVISLIALKTGTKQSPNTIQIKYNPVSGKNQFGKELDKVIDFISSNYSDPELSLRKIQVGTGVSESKVSALIREKFDLSFKQFLNQLRLNEIKRLLTETDLPISDIAYKVGYGNISHFNRVFKEAEGLSPNDFRKKKLSK
ncbi:MAG: AraC family transcriptional regulator [Cytophagaceae bacterium]|nr:AraC family transcriptional regulator [Cytophagaceae bacterium]